MSRIAATRCVMSCSMETCLVLLLLLLQGWVLSVECSICASDSTTLLKYREAPLMLACAVRLLPGPSTQVVAHLFIYECPTLLCPSDLPSLSPQIRVCLRTLHSYPFKALLFCSFHWHALCSLVGVHLMSSHFISAVSGGHTSCPY